MRRNNSHLLNACLAPFRRYIPCVLCVCIFRVEPGTYTGLCLDSTRVWLEFANANEADIIPGSCAGLSKRSVTVGSGFTSIFPLELGAYCVQLGAPVNM